MYHTGIDPLNREPVYNARDLHEKQLQKSLIFYWDPAWHALAREALVKAGRRDLIGSGPNCLVPPAEGKGSLPIHLRRRAREKPKHSARSPLKPPPRER